MKHSVFFTLTLLLSAPYTQTVLAKDPAQNNRQVHHREFVKLTDWVIQLVDGIPGAIDENAILDSLQTRNFLNKLLKGTPDPKTKTYIKNYSFNGKPVALNDLVAVEKNHDELNASLQEEFYKSLNEMKHDFKVFTKPLLENAEEARETNMRLVKEWSKLAKRTESLLLHWGAIDEEATLKACSATEFRDFCIDLKEFLHDLMYSCPKAREQFKKAFLPQNEWAKFDKAFETV